MNAVERNRVCFIPLLSLSPSSLTLHFTSLTSSRKTHHVRLLSPSLHTHHTPTALQRLPIPQIAKTDDLPLPPLRRSSPSFDLDDTLGSPLSRSSSSSNSSAAQHEQREGGTGGNDENKVGVDSASPYDVRMNLHDLVGVRRKGGDGIGGEDQVRILFDFALFSSTNERKRTDGVSRGCRLTLGSKTD